LSAGCTNTPTGDLTLVLQAEDTITGGLEPGTGEENIVDGWTAQYSKFIIAIGDVRIARSGSDVELREPTVTVIDLALLPASGLTIASFEAVDSVRWDQVFYATPSAAGATRHDSVSEADFDEMAANGWTYLIDGTLSNPTGESCPPGGACRSATSLSFRIGVPASTVFGPCQAEEGLPGVTVTRSGATASATIHGDHMFFDVFPSGAEIVERRAQWLANADTDGDGAITAEELMGIDAAELLPTSTHRLAGSPIPIETPWDFVRAQLSTQGHFQGEGECPWAIAEP
jgi:hypothetical protein